MSFLFTDCRSSSHAHPSAIWTLLIWTVALLGWTLLLNLEGGPEWWVTGGALTVLGGLLVVARRLVPDRGTAIAAWLIMSMGLMTPVLFDGVAGLAHLPQNAIIAPIFMLLPATSRRPQPATVFLISAGIGAFALGFAPLL